MTAPDRCRKGHLYTPENTYVYKRSRRCRLCQREAVVRHLAKRDLSKQRFAGRLRISLTAAGRVLAHNPQLAAEILVLRKRGGVR